MGADFICLPEAGDLGEAVIFKARELLLEEEDAI
jgi:hypothetical protein